MFKVNKCSYCDYISESEDVIKEHEQKCGHNPINKVDDEDILKISITIDKFEDAFRYVLLNDYYDKLDYFYKELERTTMTNCRATIYENRDYIKHLINATNRIEKKEVKWFNSINERDCMELINAIRICIKLPEFRVDVKDSD